ncbi:hypothetical protein OJ996_21975 [Luteolibacter sp. GHJ8]|uniref:Right handed beta helix domain-containing protein n=1 Tax=Luteolibacter rhizosphaerae TaxID=2989719 RepID=A0ABT3G8T9_9BACT|nr:hypothetical protein [Luteolibacter rhizosphaerae]MCW1916273.1 hypothetical protein [Luteolibacter rhizosphaerae]
MKSLPLMLLFSATACLAGDLFVTPQGGGARDGSSVANAAPGSAISEIFDRMAPGDRLRLGTGDYTGLSITLRTGGSPGKPKILEGTPGTRITGTWTIDKPDKGGTAITLAPGLTDVVVKQISLSHHCFAVRAHPSPDQPRARIHFEDIAIQQVRHGFYLSDCDDLLLSGCAMKRYSKHGFRFEEGCDRVTLQHCSADCSEGDAAWETKTEVFPFGFLVGDGKTPNSSFRFEDCVARNNIKSNQTVKYTNGDGFVAEGKNRDVGFLRCLALRNQDGGFDLKVKDVKLTGCIAIGHRRDFRIWHGAVLTNCFAGWSQTGLWTKSGTLTVDTCTLLAHKKSAIELDDESGGPVTLRRCLLGSDEADYTTSIGSIASGSDSILAKSIGELGITHASTPWNGEGKSMDSTKFPDKGYSSRRLNP